MFFRVEAAVRAGHTNPACTSKLCVWDVPQTKTAGESLRVKDMDFKATKFNKGSLILESFLLHSESFFIALSVLSSVLNYFHLFLLFL